MKIFVYLTDKTLENANRYGVLQRINSYKDKILAEQRIVSVDVVGSNFYKKNFSNYRLIIELQKHNKENLIAIFHDLLKRGDYKYKEFREKTRNKKTPYNIDRQLLNNWIKTQEETTNQQPARLNLTDEDYLFINGNLSLDNLENERIETIIYETEKWITKINNNQIAPFIEIIRKSLENFLIQNTKTKNISQFIQISNNLFLHVKLFVKEGRKYFWLYNIYFNENSPQDNIKKTLLEEAKRKSLRAYPSFLILDPGIWHKIQKDINANLALSPEETDLLTAALDQRIDQEENVNKGFPLFINGRAGSGKSTILQYIFSAYYGFYIKNKNKFNFKPPLFLTYTKTLAEKSKEIVLSILQNHHSFIDTTVFNDELTGVDSIMTFKDFLLSLLPEKEKDNFKERLYVDYAKFKKLFDKRFRHTLTDLNADISWHVIRGYIKGSDEGNFLSPEEYEEIPEGEKSVTESLYKRIYQEVWKQWYSTLEVWDDLDLVRFILNKNYASPEYPGIFCDEAQDFTKVELELIFKVNYFANKKVNTNDFKRIPFAFAGDPFQTLNPTGFRWESVKSRYVEKFILSLTPELTFGKPTLNYKELTFNYRSSREIVNLSNTLQLNRKIIFDYHDISPQESWNPTKTANLPAYINIGELNVNQDVLKEYLQNYVIIIPVEKGEESEFVNNDDFLKNLIEIEENVPLNVYSPMQAKGLEFPNVVLYGFGEKLGHNINDNIKSYDLSAKIQLDYAFNKLYVAITRSQQKLFFIEKNNDNINLLSKFIPNTDYLLSKLDDEEKENWKGKVGDLVRGDIRTLAADKPNWEEFANNNMNRGIIEKNTYLLRQASSIFNTINKTTKAIKCKALAFEIEENYKAAADEYYRINEFEKALKLYWLAHCYDCLIEKFSNNEAYSSKFEVAFSKLIKNISVAKTVNFLKEFLNAVQQNSNEFNNESWLHALEFLLNQVKRSKFTITEFEQVFNQFDELKKSNFDISENLLADLAYKAKKFKISYNYYLKAGHEQSQLAIEARYNFLLKEVHNNFDNLTKDDIEFMLGYYLNRPEETTKNLDKHLDLILKLYEKGGNLRKMTDFIEKSDKYKTTLASKIDLLLILLKKIIEKEIKQNNWTFVLDLLDMNVINNGGGNTYYIKKILKNHVIRNSILMNSELNNELTLFMLEKAIEYGIETKKAKDLFTEYILNMLLNNENLITSSVFPPELLRKLGCLIEKFDKYTNTLKFYEFIIYNHSKIDLNLVNFAKTRWLITKSKQKKFEEEREEKNDIRIKQIEREIHKKREDWNLQNIDTNESCIDNELDLSSLEKTPVSLQDEKFVDEKIQLKNSNIEIKVYRSKKTNKISIIFIEFTNYASIIKIDYVKRQIISLSDDIIITGNRIVLNNTDIAKISFLHNEEIKIKILDKKIELKFNN